MTISYPFENTCLHLLFTCPLYHNIRETMFYYNRDFDVKTMLFGRNDVPSDIYFKIVKSVHQVIYYVLFCIATCMTYSGLW